MSQRVCFGGAARTWAEENGVAPARLPAFVEGLQQEMRAGMAVVVVAHVDGPRAAEQQTHRPRYVGATSRRSVRA